MKISFKPTKNPEPKYTGNPTEWPAGVYTNSSGNVVIVNRIGEAIFFNSVGIFTIATNLSSFYKKISDNPAIDNICFEGTD